MIKRKEENKRSTKHYTENRETRTPLKTLKGNISSPALECGTLCTYNYRFTFSILHLVRT